MKTLFKIFLLSCTVLVFSCDDSDGDSGYKTSDAILGAWYNDEYQEYDKFMQSGMYYYEFPNTMGEGLFSGTGEYSISGKEFTMEAELLGQKVKMTNVIDTLNETKFVYHDKQEISSTFVYYKVVDEQNVNVSESVTLDLGFQTAIKDYENHSYGTVLVNPKNGAITAFAEGTGYIKLFTEKGPVYARLNVHNDRNVPLPDVTMLLGCSAAEVVEILGTPFNLNESSAYYSYKNSLLINLMALFDAETGAVYAVGITLAGNNDAAAVKSYLASKYTYSAENSTDDVCVYVDVDNRIVFQYDIVNSMLIIYSI